LFICPNSSEWPNVLQLWQLAFSLPFSNVRVEQIFSSLKHLKNFKRNSLNTSTLDDLIEIYAEGPSLDNFCADHAIDLWLEDCPTSRRSHQSERKAYKVCEKSVVDQALSRNQMIRMMKKTMTHVVTMTSHKFILDKWDQWFLSSDDSDDVSDV